MGRPHPLVEQLAEHRRTLDLSQVAASKLSGINRETLRELEVGMRTPMLTTFETLARAYGFVLTLTYLGVKWCAGCEEHKALTEFGSDRETPDGVSRRCKTCKNAQCNRNRRARAAA